ncbi:MAG: glycoside hydrolase family 113 [Aureispira sp.]
MKKLLLLISILPILFLSSFFSQNDKTTNKPVSFYLGGIQVNEANNKDWIATLKQAKMNTVEVTVYMDQGPWNGAWVAYDSVDIGVMAEIQAAKEAGLEVFLILRVSLYHWFKENRFMWHGMILPETPELIDRWFEQYQEFAEKWAKIAEEEGVDVFCIGSEMNALASTVPINKMPDLYAYYNSIPAQQAHESRAFNYKEALQKQDLWVRGYNDYPNLELYIQDRIKYNHTWGQTITFAGQPNRLKLMNARRDQCRKNWKGLIQYIRTIYSGKMTYAANFDNYMEVDFWEDLDFIGINAYFSLRDANKTFINKKVLAKHLKKGWQKVFKDIDAFRTKKELMNKPIVFTELGYINRKNTTIEPWTGFGFSVVGTGEKERLIVWDKQKKDLTERKLAVDALYQVVKEEQINLKGILYWKLTSHGYLLPYEPFALHLTMDAKDPLQTSLSKFITLPVQD